MSFVIISFSYNEIPLFITKKYKYISGIAVLTSYFIADGNSIYFDFHHKIIIKLINNNIINNSTTPSIISILLLIIYILNILLWLLLEIHNLLTYCNK